MEKWIFVAEDDDGISEVYECAFESNGYMVKCFSNAEDLFSELEKVDFPSLIVLDIMLPEMDGLTALSKLKDNTKTEPIPVILISARSEEHIKVKALVGGAEDYVTKPFSAMELVARVNKIVERNSKNHKDVISSKYVQIDDSKHLITVLSNKIVLSPKCYEILKILIENKGKVLKRDYIFDTIWGEEYFPEGRTLDIHINTIRQEIARFTDEKVVTTIRGVGFSIQE